MSTARLLRYTAWIRLLRAEWPGHVHLTGHRNVAGRSGYDQRDLL
jgi:hypothetical protein